MEMNASMTQVVGRISIMQDCPSNLASLNIEEVGVHLFKKITMYNILKRQKLIVNTQVPI